MRKILFSLLLATTAASPALADWPGHHDQSQSRDSSQSDRSDRQQERQDRSEARAEARANVRAQADDRAANAAAANAANNQAAAREQMRFGRDNSANVNERGRPTLGQGSAFDGNGSAWADRQREQAAAQQAEYQRQRQAQYQRQQEQQQREQRYDGHRGSRQYDSQQGQYYGQQGQYRGDRHDYDRDRSSRWNTDWRRDHRYDWRDYRNRHRSTFRLGVYYDPFGWGYQRFDIGFQLRPNYYSSNYWLNDPSMYALPYAPFPFRWVRYYNDALLVNTYTGQVADVIYGFFW